MSLDDQDFESLDRSSSIESDSEEGTRIQARSTSVLSTVSLNLLPFQSSPVRFFNENFKAGSVRGSVATLVVSIVGAGTLSVPLAMQKTGIGLGIIMFLLGAFLAAFTLNLLTITSEITNIRSYEKIAKRLYGPKTANIAVFTLLINLYGTSISYLVACGHTSSFVLKHFLNRNHKNRPFPWFLESQWMTLFLLVGVILPLSLLKSLSALRYSSLFGMCCTCYLAIIVMVKYFEFCQHHEEIGNFGSGGKSDQVVTCFWDDQSEILNHSNIIMKKSGAEIVIFNFEDFSQVLQAIPIVVYAYTCHPSLLPILMELKRPSIKRMARVVNSATAIACVIYLTIGIFVYLTFADQLLMSNGNFLLNDYKDDITILIGALCMAISVTFSVPLFVASFRNIVSPLVTYYFDHNAYMRLISNQRRPIHLKELSQRLLEGTDNETTEDSEKFKKTDGASNSNGKWHVLIAVLMLVLAGFPAVLVRDISYVFSVMGATTNPWLCFIFPAMFIWRAGGSEYFWTKIIAVVIAVVLPLVSLYSLYLQLRPVTWS